MDTYFSDDSNNAQPARTLADVQPPPAHPVWIAVLATFGGLIIPATAAVAAAILLGPPSVPHASRLAVLAAAALTVAEAIFAGLGAAALIEAGWRRIGLPGSGPANFLPLRYFRHRMANRHVRELIDELREAPPQPSRESLRALLDLSRELARRDIYTRAHSGRVSRLCVEVGERIGLSPEDCEIARLAGLLHDIGKLEIPSSILNKPGPLDPDEAELVRSHPIIGASLVAPYIGADVVNAVRYHHERVDGAGYPDGVFGDALPLIARLVPVVDTYDALISDRSYRPGRSREEAFVELRAVAGTQLDGELVEALIEVEAAKVPFGGALLGLAPVSALLRRAEHLLHNSAAPAAAAITAIAVAGAGWLGVMSSTQVAAQRNSRPPSVVKATPSPTPSDATTLPVVPAGDTSTVTPSPTPPGTGLPLYPIFFGSAPGSAKSKGSTGGGGVLIPPKSALTSSTTTQHVIVIPVSVGQPAGPGNPGPAPGGNPAPPPAAAAPVVTSISPAQGPVGTVVTVNGSNFVGAASVQFGANPGTGMTVNSATRITVTAPPGSGTVPVTVTGPGGTSAAGAAYKYLGPTVTSITDQYGNGTNTDGDTYGPPSGGTPVTISGSNLTGATSVVFGSDNAISFHVDSDTQITAVSPPFSGTSEEAIYVSTPAGSNATTSDGTEFDYDPNVEAIGPSSGGAGTQVTISGSNLTGASVRFGNAAAAILSQSDTAIVVSAPAPTSGGKVDITAVNSSGSSDTRPFDQFAYNRPSGLTLNPASGFAGNQVTISGQYLTGATVRFGAAAASIISESDTSIVVTVPANPVGTRQTVVVTTKAGATSGPQFTYLIPAPTISSLSPAGGVSTTVTPVVISGANLYNVTSVSFGAAGTATVLATSSNGSSVTVLAPVAGVAEQVQVVVVTAQGTSNALTFTYL